MRGSTSFGFSEGFHLPTSVATCALKWHKTCKRHTVSVPVKTPLDAFFIVVAGPTNFYAIGNETCHGNGLHVLIFSQKKGL